MKIVFKRFIAYLLDIILVTLISSILISVKFINVEYDKYMEAYNNYTTEHNEYDKVIDNIFLSYEDKKITNKEYKKIIKIDNKYSNELKMYYEDKKISKDEYKNYMEKINKDYSKIQLDNSYLLTKYSKINVIVTSLCILMYFTLMPYFCKGQTFGKKIMGIKIVSNKDKKLKYSNYLLRSLIVNEVFINILNVLCILILSKNNFIMYNKIMYVVTYILEVSIVISILFDKNNRGIHDLLSGTKVIGIEGYNEV